jgi:hypothetical protein
MKKITKLLLMTAIAIGMVACSNDDNLPDAPDANAAKGNTYASISIKLPKGPSTRALPKDYNDKGTWEGIDAIETINVFLVNSTANTVDVGTFTKDSFDGIDSQGILFPNVALKATAGEKVKAYVVLNGDDSDILADLKAPTTTAANFDAKYNAVISEVASKLAKNNGTNDIIMMTNTVAPVEKEVKAGVSEGDAMAGSVNTFMVDVERVVSRAIVTAKSTAKEAEIKVLDALGGEASTITIKDLKYVVGQSNNQFYMIKQDGYKTPDTVYNHVPSVDTWKPALFDNTGLANSTEVKTAAGTALDDFSGALTGEGVNSKFVLPVTHEDDKYEKGNTTYFEVTAIFTPDYVDGTGTYSPGNDVFLGMKDGKFYTSRELAEAEGQKATHYKGGTGGAIMKYVLWLNPNEIPGAAAGKKATMSPTVRNQVYHAHITGFKQIGLPNNPLNPTDPMNPDPDNPTDPTKPGNFNPINPIKPTDPLQTEDTYLSVQITVLPWGIHSYEINLGNDY